MIFKIVRNNKQRQDNIPSTIISDCYVKLTIQDNKMLNWKDIQQWKQKLIFHIRTLFILHFTFQFT